MLVRSWQVNRRAAIGLLLIALAAARAQSVPRLEFEVASIKPNKSGSGGWSFDVADGRLTAVNTSLKACLRWAYGIRDYQIRGPDWIGSKRYDIVAVAPSAVPDAETMQMLQFLLADRFKVVLHHETSTLPVYRLVVAKNGPKLHEVQAHDQRDSFHPGELSARGMPIAQLADFLARRLDRPVCLHGHYCRLSEASISV